MRFDDPIILLFLLLIPLVGWRAFSRRKAEAAVPFPLLHAVRGYRGGLTARMRPLVEGLWLASAALLIVAAARPQLLTPLEGEPVEGVDMVLVIDTSASMKSLDGGRTKLDQVKRMAREFVAGRTVDRIGLVSFAGDAVMTCPVTDDYRYLSTFVEDLEFGALPSGTALGPAVAAASNLLRDSEAASRVIILLTDGINNSGEIEPLTAAAAARALGIRIYTIQEGDAAEQQIANLQTNFETNIDYLREMARLTGGAYFQIPSPRELLLVYEEIDRLEKERLRSSSYGYEDVYHWPVMGAMALLVVESVLRGTRFRRLP
ncbi:MAG TPA: VWA domain-containing protein [Deltaproteobacteria bacterium]|nr:VWA domain-containing protein [Deltaproteobacteria bacterium]